MIVVDASAALDGLLDAGGHRGIARGLVGAAGLVAAPDLIDVEVLSVLRRWERDRKIGTARARQALDDLQALPLIRYPAHVPVEQAWALRHNLTACDAQYVALARLLTAPLMTTDARMARAAARARVNVYAADE